MATIPSGVGYSKGKVYKPNGDLFFEFDYDINLELDELFSNPGDLVGLNADISGLPDELIIDGVTYEINRDDERPQIEAILADIQAAFDLPTLQHARAAARIMWRIARRF